MKYSNLRKVSVLGIGGKGSYYIVKFLHYLGVEITGFDIKENDRTKELESLGIKINYRNPNEGESLEGDFYLYSNDLPLAIQEGIGNSNKDMEKYEIGNFYHQLTTDYGNDLLNDKEKEAFIKSNIAPLFQIDQNNMKYISVTGTDGKTTTCTMIYHILKNAGYKPALITTVAAYLGEEQIDTGFHTTTPTSQELFELIKKAEDYQCTHIIIEATSQGLEQGRLAGLKFHNIGYTNITYEHMDYHKTWERYCNAKSLLITEHLSKDGNITLNMDDESFKILSKLSNKYTTYSTKEKADFYATNIKENTDSIHCKINNIDCKLPIIGYFNISNFLCALSICNTEGISVEDCIKHISTFETVTGRMKILQSQPFTVIVDFAHTPNALKNALESARKLVKNNGKLINVFGCAGQRDIGKRFEMGKISNEISNISILTAEDPRLEDLKSINDQIEEGWREGNNEKGELIRFDDTTNNIKVRRDAINKALSIAKEGDVVIITGKAHEKSLCFGQTEYPWNDIEEVTTALHIA